MQHPEHVAQVQVFQWAAYNEGTYPELQNLFSVPNAAKRPGGQGQWMIDEGLKSGVPDIYLDYPAGGYHGLRIELKVKGGKVSAAQKDWLKRLSGAGYLAVVCWGYEEATATILNYINKGPQRRDPGTYPVGLEG